MKKLFFLIFILLLTGFGCARKSKEVKENPVHQENFVEIKSQKEKNKSKSFEIKNKKDKKSIDKPENSAPKEKIPPPTLSENQNQILSPKIEKKESEKKKEILVNLTIDFGEKKKTFSTNLNEGSTVYDLLQKLQKEGKISFRVRNYDFGVFIEEIEGVKNSEKEKKYWMFYVNGKLSEVGASEKKLTNGDKVLWRYEKIK